MSEYLTVSGLNLYVRMMLESDSRLRSVRLKGEISNLTDHYRSGHIYLTLKDERCAVKAVMFASNASRLRFRPKDGMKVIVTGRVTLYDVTGSYQLVIEEMLPEGIGELTIAFEQLKEKLRKEGLFDEAHKKPLPLYPKRIGVITSPTGAAVQDICRILKRRYPIGEIIMYPVMVQGDSAAAQLTKAVRDFDKSGCADVMIIGRGGGAIEDLWAFNDEELARAIYACRIPVVSAVGHETDYTICDFVADVRASTPSAGAELVSPELTALLSETLYYRRRMSEIMEKRIQQEQQRLSSLKGAKVLRSPKELIHYRRMRLDMLSNSMQSAYGQMIAGFQSRLSSAGAKLDALSPLKVLGRGYAIVRREKRIIRSVQETAPGDAIEITLQDGVLKGTVIGRKEKDNGKEN